jgi:hypothetical protein
VAMRRIWLAVRVFFAVLFHADVATRVEQAMQPDAGASISPKLPKTEPAPQPKKTPAPKAATRSEAIGLLATLQREARFVDFVKEDLGGFDDAQIGAVARDVHRDCAAVVERLFALAPVLDEQEGAPVEVPSGFDSGRFRLTGNVAGDPPFRGQLAHHGWEATKCEVPAWSGKETSARVVAPAEVELR